MKNARGAELALKVKRTVSKIGPLIHRDESRFVSTDAQVVDQAVRTRLQDTSAITSAKVKPTQKELDIVVSGARAVMEKTLGDPGLTVSITCPWRSRGRVVTSWPCGALLPPFHSRFTSILAPSTFAP